MLQSNTTYTNIKKLLHISKVYYLFPNLFYLLLATWILGSSFTVLISVVSSAVCSFSFIVFSSSLFLFAFDVSRFHLLLFSFMYLFFLFLFLRFWSLSFLKDFVVSLLVLEQKLPRQLALFR